MTRGAKATVIQGFDNNFPRMMRSQNKIIKGQWEQA